MNARIFHRTMIGDKVYACIGTAEHVAKVIAKDGTRRKFLLRFHLASGNAKEIWRSAGRCELVDRCRPMGVIPIGVDARPQTR